MAQRFCAKHCFDIHQFNSCPLTGCSSTISIQSFGRTSSCTGFGGRSCTARDPRNCQGSSRTSGSRRHLFPNSCLGQLAAAHSVASDSLRAAIGSIWLCCRTRRAHPLLAPSSGVVLGEPPLSRSCGPLWRRLSIGRGRVETRCWTLSAASTCMNEVDGRMTDV